MPRRRVQKKENIWLRIEERCTSRFNMSLSRDSFPAKWATLQREAYIWIACHTGVERDTATGNWCEERCIKSTQAYFARKKATNARIDRDLSPGTFKFAAAELLSKYVKFMERHESDF